MVYFTSSPKKIGHKVKLLIDSKLYKEKIIFDKKINTMTISLPLGDHLIEIFIDDTFNPKKLGMSADNRDLGVHFEMIKVGLDSE